MSDQMWNEINVLEDVIKKLNACSIPYMLTGSVASNYYTQPRMTKDIDIVIGVDPKDTNALIEAFKKEYYVSEDAVHAAIKKRKMFNLLHSETMIKVDFVVKKETAFRKAEFDRRILVKINGFEAFIVSKEDLILSKLWWAKDSKSEMQMGDVKNLLATGVEKAYIEKWVAKLKLDEIWKLCHHE